MRRERKSLRIGVHRADAVVLYGDRRKRERACTTLHTTGSSSGSNENEFTRSSRPPLDGDPGAAGPACAEAPRLPLASPPPPPETGRRAAVFASKLNVPSAPPDAALALGFGFGFGFGFWGACGRETRTGCGRERARRASEVGRPAARRRSGEKVLKDRRPPRGRGRMGTSVRGEGIDRSIDRSIETATSRGNGARGDVPRRTRATRAGRNSAEDARDVRDARRGTRRLSVRARRAALHERVELRFFPLEFRLKFLELLRLFRRRGRVFRLGRHPSRGVDVPTSDLRRLPRSFSARGRG